MTKPTSQNGALYYVGLTLGFLALGLGLVAVVAIIYGVWKFAIAVPQLIQGASSEVVAALIATAGTVLVTILAHVAERLYSRRKDAEESHRPKKIDCYTKFFDSVIRFTQTHDETQGEQRMKKREQQLVNDLRDFTREAILWASPSVMRAYKEFSTTVATEPEKGMLLMDTLMREIRRDLGHSNKGLNRGDLLKMFLRNPGELDTLLKNSTNRN